MTETKTFSYNLDVAIGRLKTIGGYFNLTQVQKDEFDGVAKKVFENILTNKR